VEELFGLDLLTEGMAIETKVLALIIAPVLLNY
jgi:hypothetical protein